MQGRINSFQSLGAVDGPGVRFVVFFQGCPLRCACCHNPETFNINKGGELYTADEIVQKALRYKPYFADNGGVTLSGGEPLMQADFALELIEKCKANGLHTVLDTSGAVVTPKALEAAKKADLVLLDIKQNTENEYQTFCGGSLNKVLEFARFLKEHKKPMWVRRVIIPEMNDSRQSIEALCEMLKPLLPCVEKLELLPFHKLCTEKYEALGIPFKLKNTPSADAEAVKQLNQYANSLLGL